MHKKIILTEKQTKAIANEIYGDVKEYCRINIERYVLWYLNELRKSHGQPPFKLSPNTEPCNMECDYCGIVICGNNPINDTSSEE